MRGCHARVSRSYEDDYGTTKYYDEPCGDYAFADYLCVKHFKEELKTLIGSVEFNEYQNKIKKKKIATYKRLLKKANVAP